MCSGIFFEKFNWGRKYITIAGTLCVISSMAEFTGHMLLFYSAILTILIFILISNGKKVVSFIVKHISSRTFIIVLSLISVLFLSILNREYNKREAERYSSVVFKGKESGDKDIGRSWEWIHKNTIEGKRIAYAGRGEFYPLFGHLLVNDVFYVSVNDKPPVVHYYQGGLYRNELDEKAWLKNIKESRVQLLVIYLPHREDKFPIEDQWAVSHPELFTQVFKNSLAHIYKID